MQTQQFKQAGFCLTEILISIALSSIVLFGIFSNYMLVKQLIVKQNNMASEQENIRGAYILFLKLFEQSKSVELIPNAEILNGWHSRSDVLVFITDEQQLSLYIRETQREKCYSLYMKEGHAKAMEMIPNISAMRIHQKQEGKVFGITLSFDHADVEMDFTLKNNAQK